MKNKIQAFVLFCCFFLVTFFGCLWINTYTPALYQDDNLPTNFNHQLYSAKGVEITKEGYAFHFYNPGYDQVTLILDRTAPFELYLNNEYIMNYLSTDVFNRTITIQLDTKDKESCHLEFKDLQQRNSSHEFDRLGRYRPVILLGDEQTTNNAITLSFGINMLYCGILLFICFNTFFLYRNKKSEVYLCLLSALCLVEFIKTFLSANFQVIPLTDQFVNFLLPTVYQGSSILILIIGYYLCAPYVSLKFKQKLPLKLLLPCTVLIALIQNIIPYIIISILLLILRILFLVFLFSIYSPKRKDVFYLLMGYGILLGTSAYNNYIFDQSNTTIGSFIVIFMTIQLGIIIYILCCTMVVNRKFASKFKESEELVQRLEIINATLDNQVEVRTKELNEQIKKRQNIMANIFHDLRSPVFVLQGFLDQLQPTDQELAKQKHNMQTRLSYLKHLIEDLFLMSKLENNELTYEYDDVDCGELTSSIVSSFKLLADEKNVILNASVGQEMIVWADATKLEQALINILYNAITYTKENSTVTLRVKKNHNQCQITIQDQGKGIPKDDLKSIFNRYYTSNFSRNKASSGLGLSIAYEIIQAHKGTIHVESIIDEGTIFIIELPLNI